VSLGEWPKCRGGPREGREFAAQRPRGGRLVRPGKFLSRRGWRPHLRDPAITETCREWNVRDPREEETGGVSARAHSPAAAVDAATRWKPSKPRATGDLGRHRPTGPIGLCRSAALIKTERCASAGMQRDHGSAHRTPTWVGRCDPHSAFSMPVGAGLTFIRCVAAQLGARWSLATSSRAHAKAGQNKRHGTAEQQLLTWDRVTTPRPPKRT
jgi:hypothetical protein